MSSEKQLVNNKFYIWFTRLNLHHYLLWLLYFAFWAYIYKPGLSSQDIYINSMVIVSIHAMVSYFNIYYLFPNILKKRNYVAYIVAIVLTVSFATFMETAVLMGLNTLADSAKPELFSFGFMVNAGMAVTYTTAVTMSLKLVKQWYENERLAKELEKLNTETELKYLKSQINPHFLFNSLNSVYALSLKKSDLAPELILKLSDILRYILYDGSEKKVSLSQEIKYVQSFLELEKVRHGDRLKLNVEIEGDLSKYEIAPMLLIPFVENSFKHGLGKDRSEGYINVGVKVENTNLNFVISNSKPKNVQQLSKQNGYQGGIGLKNVKKRLNLLYPQKHKLSLNEENNEFKVSLKLDLN
ncbi:MAG: histidine kinase [Bacteroidia bacterium]